MTLTTQSTDDSRTTSRGTGAAPTSALWAIVARRELMTKLTNRAFMVGSAVMLALIVGLIGLQVFLDGRTAHHEVAVVDQGGAAIVDAAAAASQDDVEIEAVVLDVADAEAAVEDEEADGWLRAEPDGSWVLVTKESADSSLERPLSEAVAETVLDGNAADAGTSVEELTAGADLGTEQLVGDAETEQIRGLLGFAFAFLFYMASIMFGMTLAQSVTEEKQSRIVEMIAAAVPLRQLLAGKVIGNTVLALGQMVLYVAVAMIGLSFTDYSHLVPSFSGAIGWFLVFFVVGFLALACLWAVAGALASRNEDLQSTSAPISMLLVAMFIGSAFLDGRWAIIASYVPPVSAIAMPQRLLQGDAVWWEPVIAMVLLLGAAGLLILAGERVYRRALLQTGGKLTLRQAWRIEE